VRNAIEATGPGGKMQIEVERVQKKGVAEALEEWIELRVTDDGPGIEPEILPKLFVPFVTTKAHGSGLGLAISQRLANTAGGRIDVRSETERGTTFVVSYPGVIEAPEVAS
jgi:two-component system, NtrC family, sensor histidine kinase HydH